jgi:hypothetical protein
VCRSRLVPHRAGAAASTDDGPGALDDADDQPAGTAALGPDDTDAGDRSAATAASRRNDTAPPRADGRSTDEPACGSGPGGASSARFPAGLRGFRVLAAVALGVCLLLACCSGGAATPAPPTGPPPAATADVLAATPLTEARPVRIRIPAIGADSALIGLGLQADGTLQVPADGSIAGWFTGSPTPGELGPAVIAAHVDWNHAPGAFFHLRDLERGDEVAVDRADGSTARFVVLGVEQYPKDAFPTERVYGDIDHAGLRLITCGGSFDRAARSYRDNVVVYAGLVGSART